MLETKSVLQEKVQLHKESIQKARAIETEIESLQEKLDRANNLLSAMTKQKQKWDEQLQTIWSRIDSVPGHALLCAASACYLARVPSSKHNILLENWLAYCFGGVSLGSLPSTTHYAQGPQFSQPHHGLSGQHQVVRIQKDFSVESVLASRDEQSRWQQESVFPDEMTLQRCLAARASCYHGATQWPLIFDPNDQFLTYLCAIHKVTVDPNGEQAISGSLPDRPFTTSSSGFNKSSVLTLKASTEHAAPALLNALLLGQTVAIVLDSFPAHITNDDREQIESILQRKFSTDTTSCLVLGDKSIPVHPDFQLYILVEQTLDNYEKFKSAYSCIRNLADFCVINLNLSTEGLKHHLQKFIIRQEKPEYGIRYKSLLTDLTLHQQQMEDSQVRTTGYATFVRVYGHI